MEAMQSDPAPSARPLDVQRNISAVVRLLLVANQQDQKSLAPILGIAEDGVSKAMSGSRRWSIENLVALADHFGEPMDTFLAEPKSLLRSRCFAPLTLVSDTTLDTDDPTSILAPGLNIDELADDLEATRRRATMRAVPTVRDADRLFTDSANDTTVIVTPRP